MPTLHPRARVIVIAVVVVAALAALIWYLSNKNQTKPVTPVTLPPQGEPRDAPTTQPVTQPTTTPTGSPSAAPSPGASATPSTLATPTATPATPASPQTGASPSSHMNFPTPYPSVNSATGGGVSKLLVPVEGVRPEQLQDTYTAARSAGRVHNAIDIIAARGTPVVAAADGTVVKLFLSKPGGITVYQLADDNQHIYYYAHLDRYAADLREGQRVRRGQTIAYVGDTGNAGAGNYHLHFSVSIVSDPKRYWDGENINPYPLLTGKQ